jgi:hypothetical protein
MLIFLLACLAPFWTLGMAIVANLAYSEYRKERNYR